MPLTPYHSSPPLEALSSPRSSRAATDSDSSVGKGSPISERPAASQQDHRSSCLQPCVPNQSNRDQGVVAVDEDDLNGPTRQQRSRPTANTRNWSPTIPSTADAQRAATTSDGTGKHRPNATAVRERSPQCETGMRRGRQQIRRRTHDGSPRAVPSGGEPGTQLAKDSFQGLKRRLFPRLVALRLAFTDWDDHLQSGRWHTDFILARSTQDNLADYRAILSMLPYTSSPSSLAESSFSNAHERRLAICVIQGLDAFRADWDAEFRPLSQTALIHSSSMGTGSPSHPNTDAPASCSSSTATRQSAVPRQMRHGCSLSSRPILSDNHDIVVPQPTSGPFPGRRPRIPVHHLDHHSYSPVSRQANSLRRHEPVADVDDGDDDQYSNHDVIPVDSCCFVRRKYHVVRGNDNAWSCYLIRDNRRDTHQFFLMQLLEKKAGRGYVFYWRWGREEEDGDTNFRTAESLKEGCRLFEETFEFKTGNQWYGSVLRTLPRFLPVKGKFDLHDDVM